MLALLSIFCCTGLSPPGSNLTRLLFQLVTMLWRHVIVGCIRLWNRSSCFRFATLLLALGLLCVPQLLCLIFGELVSFLSGFFPLDGFLAVVCCALLSTSFPVLALSLDRLCDRWRGRYGLFHGTDRLRLWVALSRVLDSCKCPRLGRWSVREVVGNMDRLQSLAHIFKPQTLTYLEVQCLEEGAGCISGRQVSKKRLARGLSFFLHDNGLSCQSRTLVRQMARQQFEVFFLRRVPEVVLELGATETLPIHGMQVPICRVMLAAEEDDGLCGLLDRDELSRSHFC